MAAGVEYRNRPFLKDKFPYNGTDDGNEPFITVGRGGRVRRGANRQLYNFRNRSDTLDSSKSGNRDRNGRERGGFVKGREQTYENDRKVERLIENKNKEKMLEYTFAQAVNNENVIASNDKRMKQKKLYNDERSETFLKKGIWFIRNNKINFQLYIDEIETMMGSDSIQSFQFVGFNRVEMFMTSEQLATELTLAGMAVDSWEVRVYHLIKYPQKIYISDIKPWISDADIITSLAHLGYTEDEKLERVYYINSKGEITSIETGTRIVNLIRKSDSVLPYKVNLHICGDTHMLTLTPDHVKCYGCGQSGHIGKQCVYYNEEKFNRDFPVLRETTIKNQSKLGEDDMRERMTEKDTNRLCILESERDLASMENIDKDEKIVCDNNDKDDKDADQENMDEVLVNTNEANVMEMIDMKNMEQGSQEEGLKTEDFQWNEKLQEVEKEFQEINNGRKEAKKVRRRKKLKLDGETDLNGEESTSSEKDDELIDNRQSKNPNCTSESMMELDKTIKVISKENINAVVIIEESGEEKAEGNTIKENEDSEDDVTNVSENLNSAYGKINRQDPNKLKQDILDILEIIDQASERKKLRRKQYSEGDVAKIKTKDLLLMISENAEILDSYGRLAEIKDLLGARIAYDREMKKRQVEKGISAKSISESLGYQVESEDLILKNEIWQDKYKMEAPVSRTFYDKLDIIEVATNNKRYMGTYPENIIENLNPQEYTDFLVKNCTYLRKIQKLRMAYNLIISIRKGKKLPEIDEPDLRKIKKLMDVSSAKDLMKKRKRSL